MDEWYQTLWGIILLGALGSMLAAMLLQVTSILLNKLGPKIILKFSANLLMPYAENRYSVKMMEKSHRSELIVVNYMMTMSKYTRTQIVFIVTSGVSVIIWVSYFTMQKLPIILPLIWTCFFIMDFYKFIKCYLAVSGCVTEDMKKIGDEIKNLKKMDRYKFVEEAIKQENS